MENWSSWSFNKENKKLLLEVVKKFKSEEHNLSTPCNDLFFSLATIIDSSKNYKIEDDNFSSSDDEFDLDKDFSAIQTCKFTITESVNESSLENPDNNICDAILPDNLLVNKNVSNNDFLLFDQTVVLEEDFKNTTQLVIEMITAGKWNLEELAKLLISERNRRNDILDLLDEVWPEMVTDTNRHRFCEVLVKIKELPQVICQKAYIPWFKTCETNLTGFVQSLSKLIVYFPEYACKSFLVELLMNKDSLLVKYLDWLTEIMKPLDKKYWRTLLSEYIKGCQTHLEQYKIPVLVLLVKNCQKDLDSSDGEKLVTLCKTAALDHSTNRDFASFLVFVVGAIDLERFRIEMLSISQKLKGASKYLVIKALKDVK